MEPMDPGGGPALDFGRRHCPFIGIGHGLSGLASLFWAGDSALGGIRFAVQLPRNLRRAWLRGYAF